MQAVSEVVGTKIGKVTHFFGKIGVAVVKLGKDVKVGEKIRIKGNKTDFEQKIANIQIDHHNLKEAPADEEIGLKVKEKVRVNDTVYRLPE